jgi:putative sigma-54 modulation protein
VRTIVKGKNVDLPARVRSYADLKLARLGRLLDERSDATMELWTEQHRSTAHSHIAEVSLLIDGELVRGRASGSTYQAAIDEVADRLERRAIEFKEKPRLRSRSLEEEWLLTRIADGTADRTRERRIVKTKRFAIEPMFEEDAISRMEELGHAFFIFVNAENERMNVLYRRRDGGLGLIEPVVGGGYSTGEVASAGPPEAARR